MTTLDDLLSTEDRHRERTREAGQQIAGCARVGIWGVGWTLAKLVLLLMACVAGVIYGIGWVLAKTVPVLRWMKAAFTLGWEAGRRRGPA